MKRINLMVTLGSLLLALPASAEGTKLLGERIVGDAGEWDTIVVGVDEGRFRGVQVQALKSAIEFKRVVIHFENGEEQVFSRNRILRRGRKSRVIDLEGGSRFIEKVVFHYEARSRGWRGARIKLWGIR